MYYYLYDSFLNDRKYEKVLDKIKTGLLDLDIQGKHERLSLLKNIEALVNDEAKRGTKTVIVVGNDKTFLKAVDVATKNGLTLGIIPIGPDNQIAENLGIPQEEKACDVIAARIISEFDLGQVGEHYFFTNLKIHKNIDRLTINHQGYRVMTRPGCSQVAVYNSNFAESNVDELMNKVSAQDGRLDLVFKSDIIPEGWKKYFTKNRDSMVDSVIQGVNFEIKSFEYLPIMIDEYKVVKTPVAVKLANKKLKVIVGKSKNINIK